jgi:hypothetical protein
MRRVVFNAVHAPTSVTRQLSPGLSWGHWHLPVLFEVGVVVLVSVALLSGAIYQFTRPE